MIYKISSMKVLLFLLLVFLAGMSQVCSQDLKDARNYYPIHEKPEILIRPSQYTARENPALIDAKPIVYYSFYNNMSKLYGINSHTRSFYTSFQPHVRIYTDSSLPVKTPSYKVLLGYQESWKMKNDVLYTLAIESGHYSNGQSGCSFSTVFSDESPFCDAIYATINDDTNLAAILNRESGDFSTNITKLSFQRRYGHFNPKDKYSSNSFTFSYLIYHDRMFGAFEVGGISDLDRRLYPNGELALNYELNFFKRILGEKRRLSLMGNLGYFIGAHPSVEPFRLEARVAFFPWNSDFGFLIKYHAGRDDYNYRFVDSGQQIGVGLTWDWFTSFQIRRDIETKKKL